MLSFEANSKFQKTLYLWKGILNKSNIHQGIIIVEGVIIEDYELDTQLNINR